MRDRRTTEKLQTLEHLLDKYSEVFSNDPGVTDLMEHNIKLTEDNPVKIRKTAKSIPQTERNFKERDQAYARAEYHK